MNSSIDNRTDKEIAGQTGEKWGAGRNLSLVEISRLAGAGSSRSYFRLLFGYPDADAANEDGLKNHVTLIATVGKSAVENRAFVSLARLFASHSLPVPEILDESEDGGCYLQRDLGDTSLYSLLGGDESVEILKKAAEILPRFQFLPEEEWAGLVFNDEFGAKQVISDLHYFKDCFLKCIGIEFDERLLEREFEEIARLVSEIPRKYVGLMMRDCQSRNIMVYDSHPYFIDFQGARRGPALYDAVSLLWQAKSGFSPELRQEVLRHYAESACSLINSKADNAASVDELLRSVPLMILIRTLQVLGAYGLRGIIEKKSHFLSSIPFAIGNLRQILTDPCRIGSPCGWEGSIGGKFPELCRISEQLSHHHVMMDARRPACAAGRLLVTVYSFSYKKGYPVDYSGNGGGFMFDCRGLHNPGRYEEYKQLTGMDSAVKEYLERYSEVAEFIESAGTMVSHSVERYAERGFSSLQVGFGCTGGRHRSVYCAERIARKIADSYPEVVVRVIHRERGVEYILNGSPTSFFAMIPAAGLGTRLRPWTFEHPKALVPVAGEPMIKRVMGRLLEQGAKWIGVNMCHFANQLDEYLHSEEITRLLTRYKAEVGLSDETGCLLETGGGILKMAKMRSEEVSYLVHNADILSNADLARLVEIHRSNNEEGVTLLVSDRESSRKLRFADDGQLAGWINSKTGEVKKVNPHPGLRINPNTDADSGELSVAQGELAFSGIYVVGHKALLEMASLWGTDPFAVMEYFLHPSRQCAVVGVAQQNLELLDIGKPDALAKASKWVEEHC